MTAGPIIGANGNRTIDSGRIRTVGRGNKKQRIYTGIWTAPLQIEALSYPAMRTPEILIKNQNGDPLPSDAGGHYLVDPTHPAGKSFYKSYILVYTISVSGF